MSPALIHGVEGYFGVSIRIPSSIELPPRVADGVSSKCTLGDLPPGPGMLGESLVSGINHLAVHGFLDKVVESCREVLDREILDSRADFLLQASSHLVHNDVFREGRLNIHASSIDILDEVCDRTPLV